MSMIPGWQLVPAQPTPEMIAAGRQARQDGYSEVAIFDAMLAATPPPPRDAGREADARDAARYRELATPEIHDFLKAVEREALHQRDRWGAEHDAGKTDADWFWLIGYLAGKAINKPEKLLHHVITTAAACLNWHAARVGAHTAMRPGIADSEAVRALAGGE